MKDLYSEKLCSVEKHLEINKKIMCQNQDIVEEDKEDVRNHLVDVECVQKIEPLIED